MSARRKPFGVTVTLFVALLTQSATSIRRGDLFGLRRRERQLHWHHDWEEGMRHSLRWYKADWVASITDFFCDPSCQERIKRAPTIDREFKALVHLFNMTTGGPRSPVYRGAFEGLGEYQLDQAGGGAASRRDLSRNKWRHMDGWESILTAHTSTQTLCPSSPPRRASTTPPRPTAPRSDYMHRYPRGRSPRRRSSDFCYDNRAVNTAWAPPPGPVPSRLHLRAPILLARGTPTSSSALL